MTRSRTSLAVALIALSLAALAVSLAARRALAQDLTYRRPPEVVAKILTAPRLPRGAPNVSPDGARLVVPELPSLIPIAALAEPVEKLAGLEILPAMRATRTALKRAATGLTIVSISGGRPVRAQLPDSSRVMDAAWSNDGRSLACAVMAEGGADLWIVDAATGAARQVAGVKLNHVLVRHLEWSADDRNLYCAVVPPGQIPPRPASRVPAGPQVRVGAGRAAPQRTARDVLRTADDQDRFTWYLMAQLARVAVASGSVDRLGVPVMMRDWRLAPDEKHFIVERFNEKLPLGFPYELFPGRVEVWNADGGFAARVGVVPLNDRSAISSVAPLGPREVGWAPDGQSLYYFSWADTPGGEPMKAVKDTTVAQPGTDRLMRAVTPFTSDPEVVATSADMRFESWAPIGDTRRVLLGSVYEPRRVEQVEWLDLSKPAERHVLTLRSSEGVYDDPGRPVLQRRGHEMVVRTNAAGTIEYLAGEGFRKEGQRPFLDRCDLASGRVTRLFESDDKHLEPVVAVLDDAAKRFLTTRESSHEPPNFWLRRAGEKNGTQLTSFTDPAPALTASQRIHFTFTRPDSVKLHAEAVLPADWTPGHPLPTIFWIYPNDYRSAAAAQENRSSPNRFPSQSTLNPEVLVTQGYCVVRPDIAVVGTNDRYVEEIQASARAAVDECVRRGFTDRDRIGVGGHSYGAFSTANMLAHTDLFRAGTASDGAYNRTLTPFTFQAEDRTLWQAPETYLAMSPFVHADQIRAPLLIFHNLDDTNVGTNPIQSDRMFEALNGMGKTVMLVQYPYEDHIPVAKETVLDYWARAIDWFDRYVKNAGAGAATPGTKSKQ